MNEPGRRMLAEIAEQPVVLGRLVARFDQIADQIAAMTGPTTVGVAFVARGSSDFAALFARYAVGRRVGLPTSLLAPSLTTVFGGTPQRFADWLVVAFSQSGETPEIVSVARAYQAAGASIVAVTNAPDSPLSEVADVAIALNAGPELAVPATKTVTAEMLVGLALAAAVAGDRDHDGVDAIPDAVASLVTDYEPVNRLATQLAGSTRLAVVGRGFAYPAAFETALKLQETTGLMAHGFSTSDFRHGPIQVSGPDVPVLLLAGSLGADDETRALHEELGTREAPWHLIGSAAGSEVGWPALGTAAEGLLATVRGQQLSLSLSRLLGVDPDRPSGLHKITFTH